MTEQNAREAMEVLRSAVHAYGGELIPGENEDRAASVIAAKLAEKDADIARLWVFISRYAQHDMNCKLAMRIGSECSCMLTLNRQALKPESPDHD